MVHLAGRPRDSAADLLHEAALQQYIEDTRGRFAPEEWNLRARAIERPARVTFTDIARLKYEPEVEAIFAAIKQEGDAALQKASDDGEKAMQSTVLKDAQAAFKYKVELAESQAREERMLPRQKEPRKQGRNHSNLQEAARLADLLQQEADEQSQPHSVQKFQSSN